MNLLINYNFELGAQIFRNSLSIIRVFQDAAVAYNNSKLEEEVVSSAIDSEVDEDMADIASDLQDAKVKEADSANVLENVELDDVKEVVQQDAEQDRCDN